MTSNTPAVEGPVDGGLDEPTGLEPEQGALALAHPEDQHTRADWEKATAAVLRKARRMSDEEEDALVWDKLTRTTLDGIAVVPLGTPDLLDDLGPVARPTRAGAWDIRAHLGAGVAKQSNEDALVDLNGGVTSLWTAAAPDTDFATLLDGVFLDLAPVVLEATSDPAATAQAFLSWVGDLELHPGTNLGVPASLATPELAAAAQERGILAFVVDGTTVHDRGASDAQELGWSMTEGADCLRT
ncbi:MAG: methylmalonyl-CoA mutase, partial [Nocardioides sp.]